jgi:hypothetical protein
MVVLWVFKHENIKALKDYTIVFMFTCFNVFMRKLYTSILISFFIFSCLVFAIKPTLADGYGLQTTAGAVGYDTSGNGGAIPFIINRIISVALIVLMFVFFGLTVYSGFRWMLARGNDEFVQKAKDTLQGAIIGLVIVSLAYALTKFIFSRLGG